MKLGWVVAVMAVLLSLMVGIGFMLWHHPDRVADLIGFCGNTDVREYPGPGRYKAFVYTRDCGATTSWTTHVAVVRHAARRPAGKGNAFIAGWRLNARPDGYAGGPPVRLGWRSGTRLVITYDERTRAPYMSGRVDDVVIEYVGVADPIDTAVTTP